MTTTHNRNGHDNAIYDPDRDAISMRSDGHFHEIMRGWGYDGNWEEHEGHTVINRYCHTDFTYYDKVPMTIQKKAIAEMGYPTITIPAHTWNDNTEFADYLFHGYRRANNHAVLNRAVLVDTRLLRNIKHTGKRTNMSTGTVFYYWDYTAITSAIVKTYNLPDVPVGW
jgi:hypothetical protein